MRFTKEYYDIYKQAIKPAVLECGFIPIIINESVSNKKICDQIIDAIKDAHFVIADFSDHR